MCIETIQDTVNGGLDKVEVNCGRAYIIGITDAAASDVDEYMIGIFLLRSDLTLFSSVSRDIFKSNDLESVCALHALVLEAL